MTLQMNKQIVPEYKQTKVGIIPEDWSIGKIGKIFTKVSTPVAINVNEQYQEIGIRSHGKGIFYKEKILGKDLGNKSVFWIKKDCLILNIVFAWEQAIAKTTDEQSGMIASHRFPMYRPNHEQANIDYFLYLFSFYISPLNLVSDSLYHSKKNCNFFSIFYPKHHFVYCRLAFNE